MAIVEKHADPAGGRSARRTHRLSDPRSQRSREALRGGLLRLIERQSFDKITLREITAEAGLSYPTFFNHYDDKEALFLDIARQEINTLLEAFREGRTSPEWRPGKGVCSLIAERRNLWRTLLTAGASEAMRSEFIRRGRDLAKDEPKLGHGFPVDVVSGVIASGMFEIVAWWLSQDLEVPQAEVADMLETMVIEPALNVSPGFFTTRGSKP